MSYFKSLFYNFLAIFFVNQMIPGIEVVHPTKLPNIQGDLLFSLGFGFLLSLIYPLFRLFRSYPDAPKVGVASFCLSFGVYAILNFLPVEIKVTTFSGYFWGSLIVFFNSFLTNTLKCKSSISAPIGREKNFPPE